MLFNLLFGLLLSVILAVYYSRWGDSLSNRSKFAPLLPLLSMITLLVISVVKSSLALSLGLVGALSIVRFRTAIKDPEELMFLFFAISIGLGLGADQRITTVVAYVVIMGYLIARKALQKSLHFSPHNNLYLNVSLPLGSTTNESAFQYIQETLGEELPKVDLRRFDTDGKELRMVFYFQSNSVDTVSNITRRIQEKYDNAVISVVEQNNLLGG
jgi:uncharacterized membrane protein YhiD involved in acid resistance